MKKEAGDLKENKEGGFGGGKGRGNDVITISRNKNKF